MEIRFERANANDAEVLIDVKNKSFYSDYIKYGECPGYGNSKEHMVNSILNVMSYKIICDDKVVGNITARDCHKNIYYIGCLCIIPDYQNKKIGQKAIKFIESQIPNAEVWTLKTPADSKRNIYFYEKMGYKITDRIKEGSVNLVILEKSRRTR